MAGTQARTAGALSPPHMAARGWPAGPLEFWRLVGDKEARGWCSAAAPELGPVVMADA
jgi:hypothetical protein